MANPTLAQSVEKFAATTHAYTDQDLERQWVWREYDEGVRFAFFRTYEQLQELAARLLAERPTSGTQLTTAHHILSQYQAAYWDLQAVLIGLSEEEALREPAAEEWPLMRIVLHIVQAEYAFYAVNHYAVERLRAADDRPVEMPEETWKDCWVSDASEELKGSQSLSTVMAYYDVLHGRIIGDFASITEAELNAPAVFWETEPMPVEFRLHRFDSHLRQHTVQVEKTLEMLDLQPNDPRRLLRLIYAALAEVEGAVIGAPEFGLGQCNDLAEVIALRADEIDRLIDR